MHGLLRAPVVAVLVPREPIGCLVVSKPDAPAVLVRPILGLVVDDGLYHGYGSGVEGGLGASDLSDDGFDLRDGPDGHVLLGEDVLGLRLSDHITCEIFGFPVDLAFMHANARHHSVAFGGELDKNIHHFMLEVRHLDDVGLAYDRAIRARLPIANTLGRHPNDGMVSFYAHTPSGFQFEFGWGGVEVDDATWQPTTHGRISDWGHHPPVRLQPRRKKSPADSGETGP